MSDRRAIEAKLQRLAGMSEARKAEVRAFNAKQDWTVQCWNCRGKVERKLSDLHGPCPHCGVELSKRA